MKADPAVQRRLLALAEVDAELARAQHRRRTLPEIAEITATEQSLQAKRDAQVAVATKLADLDREVARQEKDIDAVRAREERDAGLLAGGTLGHKQMTEMEHELVTLRRRQSSLEDDLLELMEQREAVELDAKHAEVEVAAAQHSLAESVSRRDEAFADIDTVHARRTAERATVVPEIPEPLLAQYERIRANKGIGAALLRSRKCGACRIELDRSAISRIKDAPADEVLNCDECGVILVRTPESGL